VSFGVLFLPMSIWFAYVDWQRNWGKSLVLFAVSMFFLKLGLTRNPDSWITMIDDLGGDRSDQ